MYKRFIFLYFILSFSIGRTQNLVPNPSFEEQYDCIYATLGNAKEWCSVSRNCSYYFPCQSNLYYKAPFQYYDNCLQSFQIPRTGQAYAELYGFITTSTITPNKYAQVRLVDTLKLNKTYCVSFYLSLFNFSQYSTDKIGAVLTPTPFPCLPPATAPNYTVTGVIPQIVSPAGVQLDDTLNWMEVSATYTANGTETYLTIGDFFLQSQHSITQSYPTNCNAVAEYYLDDVSVEEVQIAKAKNDTLIYAGDSTIIGNNASEAALFSWQPSAGLSCANCPNPKASPTITTTYTVTKTQCKSVTTDVITISVSPVGINELSINNAIMLQPNPTNGLININSRFEMQKIEVMNVAGQLLFSQSTTEKNHQLNLNDFAEGIYFVRVIYANGLNSIKKIVVQH